jgi:hypothetical protein
MPKCCTNCSRERNISNPVQMELDYVLSLVQVSILRTQPHYFVGRNEAQEGPALPFFPGCTQSHTVRPSVRPSVTSLSPRHPRPARSQEKKNVSKPQWRSPACVPPYTAPPRRGILPNPSASTWLAGRAHPTFTQLQTPGAPGRQSATRTAALAKRSRPGPRAHGHGRGSLPLFPRPHAAHAASVSVRSSGAIETPRHAPPLLPCTFLPPKARARGPKTSAFSCPPACLLVIAAAHEPPAPCRPALYGSAPTSPRGARKRSRQKPPPRRARRVTKHHLLSLPFFD